MIEEYINKRLNKVGTMLQPIDWNLWNLGKVTIAIEFFPIPYDFGNWTAFIPTGSKDLPAGLSTVNNAFVLFFDQQREGPQFYYDADLIKEYMGKNRSKLAEHQESDKDYVTIGYKVDLKDLFAYCGKSPTVVTVPD